MERFKQIKISFYRNCFTAVPINEISLYDWLLSESILRKKVDEIRKESDVKKKTKLKMELPAATIGGVFSGRTLDSLVKDSRLICIDIDGKDNPTVDNMEDLKMQIASLPYILYCGLSVGGKGLMCIIELKYPDRFLNQYLALEFKFSSMGIIIDKKCKDKNHLRIYSYDNNHYLNVNAAVFEECLEQSRQYISFSPNAAVRTHKTDKPIKPVNDNIDDIFETYLNPINLDQKTMVVFKHPVQLQIYVLIKKAVARKIDITVIPDDWIAICYVIKRYFSIDKATDVDENNDDGLDLFLEVSQFFPKFTVEECTETYQKINIERYKYAADRFFSICEKYGILY